jgi:hypothetical protein
MPNKDVEINTDATPEAAVNNAMQTVARVAKLDIESRQALRKYRVHGVKCSRTTGSYIAFTEMVDIDAPSAQAARMAFIKSNANLLTDDEVGNWNVSAVALKICFGD